MSQFIHKIIRNVVLELQDLDDNDDFVGGIPFLNVLRVKKWLKEA